MTYVAPVRERGLKLQFASSCRIEGFSRSREGAWIEIMTLRPTSRRSGSRSREGAWIEIALAISRLGAFKVAPVRERGLKLLTLATLFGPA